MAMTVKELIRELLDCDLDKAENKMPEVAKLFGKELGEEFTLIDENREKYRAVINKNGLRVHGMYKGFWEDTFFKLIVGTAVIVDD
jgi:hypothetical protein